jgi:hyaluronan synthase
MLRLALALLVITPLIGSLILELELAPIAATVTFGVYGLWVTFHFLLQIVFSLRNYHDMERLALVSTDELGIDGTVGVQIVGYREDPVVFEQCCRSVARIFRQQSALRHVVCVVDGNESEAADLYMARVFQRVFPEAQHVNLSRLPTSREDLPACGASALVITQPHGGKREALHTALLYNLASDVDYTLFVDSDTILDPLAAEHLKKVLDRDVRQQVGAVAGDVRILNLSNLLTLLTSLKYYMAFNIERAAQSSFGVVVCVGGPLGLYRNTVLRQILQPWYTQTFLGKPCTYGDDRHLTNQVLKLGLQVKYNHRSFCYTDTPETVNRWLLQQIRWNKSGLREFWFTVRQLHKHSLWLTFDLIFVMFYSFFIIAVLLIILLRFEVVQLAALYAVIFITSGLRSLYGCIMKRDWHFLAMAWYGFLYIHMVLPTKLWASLTLWSTGWGTSNRFQISDANTALIPLVLWNGTLAAGIGCTFWLDHEELTPALSTTLACLVASTLLLWLTERFWIAGPAWKVQKYLNEVHSLDDLVAAGSQPFVAAGSQPFVAAGSQPFVAAGSQPFVAAGSQPLVAAGSQSLVDIFHPL